MKNFIKDHHMVAAFGIFTVGKAIHDVVYYADRIVENVLYHGSYRRYLDAFGVEEVGKPKRNWERLNEAMKEQGYVKDDEKENTNEQTEQAFGSDEDELLGESKEESRES